LTLGRALLLCVIASIIYLPSAVLAKQGVTVGSFPPAGSYVLQRIFKSPDGLVLEDSDRFAQPLSRYTNGKVTLLTFFYSLCRDPTGCPAIWSTYETLHDVIQKRPELHGKIRLVFVSLDPRLDTPERLQVFSIARRATHAIAPWHFLTTKSERFLGPILDGFGQSAARDLDANGNPVLTISHQVKFYLIDKRSWVREIYSSGFIDPDVVETDMRTLLMEAGDLPSVD